jgi:hypothetical protein
LLTTTVDDVSGASTIGERTRTLDDLKRYFQKNGSSSSSLDNLDDKNWNTVFNTLFDIVAADRASYLKTSAKTTRTTLSSKLGDLARAIRAIGEIAVSRIKIRAVKNIIKHIIDTLPTTTGIIDALGLDYLKLMRRVLEGQQHVEHLGETTWRLALEFCVVSLDHFQEPMADDNASYSRGTVRSSNTSSLLGSMDRPSKAPSSRLETDELVACIKCLHLASNSNGLNLADATINSLIEYLELITSYGRAHLDALMALNLILERISQSNVDLTTNTVKRLLPVLSSLWAFKSSQLRDEILRFLILTRLHVVKEFEGDVDDAFKTGVDNFIATLREDFSQRSSKDQLHLDDLVLKFTSQYSLSRLPAAYGLGLRASNSRAESDWTGIYFLSFYSMLMDQNRSKIQQSERANELNGSKRVRISTYADDFMRSCSSATTRTQVCMLELMTFRVTMEAIAVDDLEDIMAFATDYSSGSNPSVASWAYLLLAQ